SLFFIEWNIMFLTQQKNVKQISTAHQPPPNRCIILRIVSNSVVNSVLTSVIYKPRKNKKTTKLIKILIGNPTTNTFNCGTVLAIIPNATTTRNKQPTIGIAI